MPMVSLRDHSDRLKLVVEEAIRKTFSLYFGIDVDIEGRDLFVPVHDGVLCRTRMYDARGAWGVIFIEMERAILRQMSEAVYPKGQVLSDDMVEACAVEITNIVCTRVKTYFNETGYDLSMDIPSVAEAGETLSDDIKFIFSVKNDKLVIDIGFSTESLAQYTTV